MPASATCSCSGSSTTWPPRPTPSTRRPATRTSRRSPSSGPWHIYEVADAAPVAGLANQPVVLDGVDQSQDGWLPTASAWFGNQDELDVLMAAHGPDSWERVEAEPVPTDMRHLVKYARDQLGQTGAIDQVPELPRKALPEVDVSDIEMGDDSISFTVDKVGVPVLVKTSYFPNWEVTGAEGPYRVSPNLMVVIPTSNEVSMHFGRTPVDLAAMFLTLLGLIGLVWLARSPAIAVEPERPTRMSDWIDRQLTIERRPPPPAPIRGADPRGSPARARRRVRGPRPDDHVPEQAARVLLAAARRARRRRRRRRGPGRPGPRRDVYRGGRPAHPPGSAQRLGHRLPAGVGRAGCHRGAHLGGSRAGGPGRRGGVRLSVVVPAYREAAAIAATIERIRTELAPVADAGGLEVVVVDDGSGDGTAEAARQGGADQVIELPGQPGQGGCGARRHAGRHRAHPGVHRCRPVLRPGPDRASPGPGGGRVPGGRGQPVPRALDHPGGRRRAPPARRTGDQPGHAGRARRGATTTRSAASRRSRARSPEVIFSHTRIDGFAFDVEVLHLVGAVPPVARRGRGRGRQLGHSTVRVARDALALLADLVRIRRGSKAGWYDLDAADRLRLTVKQPEPGE